MKQTQRSCACPVLLGVLVTMAATAAAPGAQEAICAQVSIQISQQAVLTRTAFEATLTIDNGTSAPLGELNVELEFEDLAGNLANDLFNFDDLTVTGASDVSGTGVIAPMSQATAQWLILPREDAAPTASTETYSVGGTVSHLQGGVLVEVPLFPVTIEVYPDAELFLDYFLQSPVYSDNPFTPTIVEPAEPFNLGLLVRNEGNGVAQGMKITSAQPEIVNNDKGLLVAFKLLGSQVGTQAVAPCLTLQLGDILPGESAVARWLMSSSLQGEFISYDATFEHTSGLGDPSLSLIEAVNLFELTHALLLDGAGDDGLPDFLARDPATPPIIDPVSGTPLEGFPDGVYSSDGQVLPVHPIVQGTVDGPPTPADQTVFLTVDVLQAGWSYIRVDDPGTSLFDIAMVSRMDLGTRSGVSVGGPGDVSNAWQTRRLLPIDAPPTSEETRLHIVDWFDAPGSYSYDLVYVEAPVIPLVAKQQYISVSAGGLQELTLDAGPANANRAYVVLGSFAGTIPGTALPLVTIPLVQDAYFDFTVTNPNSTVLPDSLGVLDGDGRSTARVELQPGTDPALNGLTAYHAFVLLPPIDYASNAVQLVLIP